MSDTPVIIPFGKYKGREVTEIAQRDPAYLQWLGQQDWAREKFPYLLNVTINNFAAAPDHTPEHNALQLRFLEEKFRKALVRTFPEVRRLAFSWRLDEGRRALDDVLQARGRPRKNTGRVWPYARENEALAALRRWRRARLSLHVSPPTFEQLCDVAFTSSWLDRDTRYGTQWIIECKPSIGDDYPAVLRQVVRAQGTGSDKRYRWVVVYEHFAATAPERQVREFFLSREVALRSVSEIEAAIE
jgi:uncharacterized protein (DUF3820 family)